MNDDDEKIPVELKPPKRGFVMGGGKVMAELYEARAVVEMAKTAFQKEALHAIAHDGDPEALFSRLLDISQRLAGIENSPYIKCLHKAQEADQRVSNLKHNINIYVSKILSGTQFEEWLPFKSETETEGGFLAFSKFYNQGSVVQFYPREVAALKVERTNLEEVEGFFAEHDSDYKFGEEFKVNEVFETTKIKFLVPRMQRDECCEYQDFESGVLEVAWFDERVDAPKGWSGNVLAISRELHNFVLPHAMIRRDKLSSVRFDIGFLSRLVGGAELEVFLPLMGTEVKR